jgi:hypothetical protein
MGASYGAVVVRTQNAAAIREAMERFGSACAIASDGAHVVVADERIDEQYSDWLRELTTHLSRAANAVSLGAMVHDDDVLLLCLSSNGSERAIYSSTDVMIDFLDEVEPGKADIDAFRSAFDIDAPTTSRLQKVLSESGIEPGTPYAFESDRHRDLCEVLALPPWCVFFSYSGLNDYPPDNFKTEKIIHYGAFPPR